MKHLFFIVIVGLVAIGRSVVSSSTVTNIVVPNEVIYELSKLPSNEDECRTLNISQDYNLAQAQQIWQEAAKTPYYIYNVSGEEIKAEGELITISRANGTMTHTPKGNAKDYKIAVTSYSYKVIGEFNNATDICTINVTPDSAFSQDKPSTIKVIPAPAFSYEEATDILILKLEKRYHSFVLTK